MQPLRVLDLAADLVAAVVDPAPFHTEAHAGAGVGADVCSGTVDRALRRNQQRFDRNLIVAQMLEIGLHRYHREIVRIDESLLQIEHERR